MNVFFTFYYISDSLYPSSAGGSADGITSKSSSNDIALALQSSKAPVAATLTADAAGTSPSDGVARPDTSQMIPFKPKFKWFAGEHRLPGGEDACVHYNSGLVFDHFSATQTWRIIEFMAKFLEFFCQNP